MEASFCSLVSLGTAVPTLFSFQSRPAPALDGEPYIHDPSTIMQCDGKFYTFGDVARCLSTQVLYNRVCQYMYDATFKSTLRTFLDRYRLAGYDLEFTKAISSASSLPVVASGGAGTLEHFYDAVVKGGASVLLAASVFHFRTFSIRQVKEYLKQKGIEVMP